VPLHALARRRAWHRLVRRARRLQLVAAVQQTSKPRPDDRRDVHPPRGLFEGRCSSAPCDRGPLGFEPDLRNGLAAWAGVTLYVNFVVDKADIDFKPKATRDALDELERVARLYRHRVIRIVGHTDSDADDAYNLKLSPRRERAVGRRREVERAMTDALLRWPCLRAKPRAPTARVGS